MKLKCLKCLNSIGTYYSTICNNETVKVYKHKNMNYVLPICDSCVEDYGLLYSFAKCTEEETFDYIKKMKVNILK